VQNGVKIMKKIKSFRTTRFLRCPPVLGKLFIGGFNTTENEEVVSFNAKEPRKLSASMRRKRGGYAAGFNAT
jgi:hypothetical protein